MRSWKAAAGHLPRANLARLLPPCRIPRSSHLLLRSDGEICPSPPSSAPILPGGDYSKSCSSAHTLLHAHEVAWKHCRLKLLSDRKSSPRLLPYWPLTMDSSECPVACLPNINCLDIDPSRYQSPSRNREGKGSSWVWRLTKLSHLSTRPLWLTR